MANRNNHIPLSFLGFLWFILGILAIIVVPIKGCFSNPQKEATLSAIEQKSEELKAIDRKSGLTPELLSNVNLIDSWGRTCQIEYSEGTVVSTLKIVSAGKDGSFGTSDDVSLVDVYKKPRIIRGVAEEWARGTVRGLKKGAKDKSE